MTEEYLVNIKETVFKERKISEEFNSLLNSLKTAKDEQEKKLIDMQAERLRNSLKKINDELLENLEKINITTPLIKDSPITKVEIKGNSKKVYKTEEKISELDREILKRLKKEKERKIIEKVEKKASQYTKISNNLFSNTAMSLIKQKKFKTVGRDLIKANLNSDLISYVSVIISATVLSFAISFLIFIFLLFFNIGPALPIITRVTEGFFVRLLEIFWIPIIIPLGTFLFMNYYPTLERKSLGGKIDLELPFAAIHMSAISGSLIDPTKIFSIIAATKEYPNLEKEFNKLLNEINIYGYDLVTALKDLALNSPSQKLSELLNGLATTITSGGNLYDFFEKRSQSLLFDYRLEKEKNTKSAETFMDIYISVVIAAPMIFMLLLMMMKISGLGVSLSTAMITILVVGGVSIINAIFLIFLQIKQSSTA
jgi:Flp pilus assembly protein TadB